MIRGDIMNGFLLGNSHNKRTIDPNDGDESWVYVLLIDSKSNFSKMIKKVTETPYNHSSISFDKTLTKMYAFNVKGFLMENLKETYIPDATFSLYRTKLDKNVIGRMKKLADKVFSEGEKYTYNWAGLGGVMLKREVKRDNAFFCSEWVAYLFANGGADHLFSKPVSLVKPYDFAKNKNFEFVYRGKVKNFEPSRVEE
jgi:hypothetical protein